MEFPPEPVDLYQYEQLARTAGYPRILGIDEAGRGPLAGPVVVAGVALPPDLQIPELNDSKQLTEARRETLYPQLTGDPAIIWSVAVIGVDAIDRLNILQATITGMRQCAEAVPADLILVDGNPIGTLSCPVISIIKGDAKCACIAAASVIAKVTRDRLMADYETTYPGYGFAAHKGYGTREHLAALRRQGPCPIHRRSFAPVAEIIRDCRQGQLDLGF